MTDEVSTPTTPQRRRGGWPRGRPRGPSPFRKKPGGPGKPVEAAAQPAAAEPKKPTGKMEPKGKWQMKPDHSWDTAERYKRQSEDRWSGQFHDAQTNALDKPAHVIEELRRNGLELCWATSEIFGRATDGQDPHAVQNRQRNGWEIIAPEDAEALHPDLGSVELGGLVLMATSTKLHAKALQKQDGDAAGVIRNMRAKHGEGIPGAMGADHVSARNYNRHRSTFEKVSVPEDGTE